MSFEISLYENFNDISSLITYCQNLNNVAKQSIAVVDASNIISLFHLQVACHHALMRKQQNHMKSKIFYDEVMLCLAGSNRINKAHSMFHIKTSTTRVAVVILPSTLEATAVEANVASSSQTSESISETITSLTQLVRSSAKEIPFDVYESESKTSSELERISKVYDLGIGEISSSGIESAIITRVAVADV